MLLGLAFFSVVSQVSSNTSPFCFLWCLMLSPLHRSQGLSLTKARRTAKHNEEAFDTCIGLPAAITGLDRHTILAIEFN
jgi:hypothetical protein